MLLSLVLGLQIEVKGVDGPLKDAAEKVLTMKPNFSYTLQEVEDEVAHVFELGWFAKCQPNAEDTRDGVKLTIEVTCLATHLMQTLYRRMLISQYDCIYNVIMPCLPWMLCMVFQTPPSSADGMQAGSNWMMHSTLTWDATQLQSFSH